MKVSTAGSVRAERKSSTEVGSKGRRQGRRSRTVWPDGPARRGAPPERRLGGAGPQAARRVREDLAHRLVALAHAGEAGRKGDLRDGQVRRLQQDAGGLAALGSGQGQRTGAHLGGDEAVELAGAVAEAAGQALDAFAVDDAVADEAHGPCHDVGPHVPLR